MMSTRNKNGFTLLELLMGLAIASVVMAAVYSVFIAQVRGQVSQDVALDMVQGSRAAMARMENEIRMARLDPTQTADAHIMIATANTLTFSMDFSDGAGGGSDGDTDDPNERVRYQLTPNHDLGRASGSGINKDTGLGGTLQPIAENIDAVNFVYLTDDNDGDGQPDVIPYSDLNDATSPNAQANRDSIRVIQITMVARGGQVVRGLIKSAIDRTLYRNQTDTDGDGHRDVIFGPANDHFRRMLWTAAVAIRNS